MSHATTSSQAPLSQADIEADDGPYIAATRVETALIIGLPFAVFVALGIAAWNGIQALSAAWGG